MISGLVDSLQGGTAASPPPPPSRWVKRDRIDRRLHLADIFGRTVRVTGPPGSGRTALLAHWWDEFDDDQELTRCWIQLGDADEATAWTRVWSGLAGADIEGANERLDDGPEGAPTGSGRLLAEVLSNSGRVLVMIDAGAPPDSVVDELGALVPGLPRNAGVVLATRQRPNWPDVNLVAADRLWLVDTRDLWFTADELVDLCQASGLDAAQIRAAELVELTGGWPALVTIALDRMLRDGHAGDELVDELNHYLLDRVLGPMGKEQRAGLVAVAMLDQLRPGDAEDLLGPQHGPIMERLVAQELLRRPEGSDSLTVPAALRRALRPVAAAELGDRYVKVATRVGELAALRGELDTAVSTFLEAGQVPRAVELVTQHADTLQRAGHAHTVARWLAALPAKETEQPVLRLVRAWDRLLAGEADTGEQLLDEVHRELGADPGVWLEVQAGRCFARRMRGDLDQAITLAEQTLATSEILDHPSPISRAPDLVATIRVQAAWARYWSGDHPGAAQELREALNLDVSPEHPGSRRASGLLARINLQYGDLDVASQLSHQSLEGEAGPTDPVVFVDARLVRAELLLEAGAVDAARSETRECLELPFARAWSLTRVDALLTLSRCELALGRPDRSHEALEQARNLFPDLRSTPREVLATTALKHARVELFAGDASRARAWLGEAAAYGVPEPAMVAARMRLRLTTGAADPEGFVSRALRLADDCGPRDALDLRLAAVRLLGSTGASDEAIGLLAQVTADAERHGFAWTMVREGPGTTTLIRELAGHQPRPATVATQSYLERLITLAASLRAGELEAAGIGTRLTKREREVTDLLRRNLTVAQVASQLYISENTVKTHIRHVYRKLGVSSRVELRDLFRLG